jgi:integrase
MATAYHQQKTRQEDEMITEAGIRGALKLAPTSGKKSIELKDDGERGAGRLMLLIRPMPKRIISEWYAVWHREVHGRSRRRMLKIGIYPLMPLSAARKAFREEYAPAISTGADPTSKHMRRRHKGAGGLATVTELFQAYVDNLKESGKPSWTVANRVLLSSEFGAAAAMGPQRTAASISPDDIVAHLASIYERGATAMADNTRAWIRSAFAWGVKSAHDYKKKDAAARWGIRINPAEAIQPDADARRVRNRFLAPAEVKAFWDWMIENARRSRYIPAAQLLLVTGQRVQEILRISDRVFDPAAQMLFWDKTKNKLPHAIPLSLRAVSIMEALSPNEHGLYFPNSAKPEAPASHTRVLALISLYVEETGCARFTPRDLRRTFKTLGGDAGISKEMRDRLQNHAKGDVSARYYDRYDYLTEKRAAVTIWDSYMDRVLAGDVKAIGERSNIVPLRAASTCELIAAQ